MRISKEVEDHIQPVSPLHSPIVLSACPTASVTLSEGATHTSKVNNKQIQYQCTHLKSFFLFHLPFKGNPFFVSSFQHFLSHIRRLVHMLVYMPCVYVYMWEKMYSNSSNLHSMGVEMNLNHLQLLLLCCSTSFLFS